MTNPMSELQFKWFLTLLTGGVSFVWFIFDARKLLRLRGASSADPTVRDQRFGYAMGLVIATIGVVGSARYQGWI